MVLLTIVADARTPPSSTPVPPAPAACRLQAQRLKFLVLDQFLLMQRNFQAAMPHRRGRLCRCQSSVHRGTGGTPPRLGVAAKC